MVAMSEIYDVIVVGGGLGGLSVGSFLAKTGRSVLVLERHRIPGGYCTDYRRGEYRFDSAVHYLGAPEMFNEIFSALSVADRVAMAPMDPEGFDVYKFPGLEFRMPNTPEKLMGRLLGHFPEEKKGIERYIKTLKNFMELSREARFGRGPGFYLKFPFRHARLLVHLRSTLADYLSKLTSDLRLRAVLGGQWGIHGEPPSRLPLFVSLGGGAHYMSGGAWYPEGGTGTISKALAEALGNFGGVIRTGCEAEEVITEKGGATGVELTDGERIAGKAVVMAGDLWDGFRRLLRNAPIKHSLADRVNRTQPSNSMIHLHIGLDRVPDEWKWKSCNIWSHPSFDHQEIFEDMKNNMIPERIPTFISVTYRKDPAAAPGGKGKYGPSVTVLGMVHHRHFERFMKMRGNRRTEDYKTLKKDVETKLLAAAEKVFPGITERARYTEVATPFTQYRYTLSHMGGSYGYARTLDNWFPGKPPWHRPLKNVWWTGSNAGFHGVMGAIQAGLETAAEISGRKVRELVGKG